MWFQSFISQALIVPVLAVVDINLVMYNSELYNNSKTV